MKVIVVAFACLGFLIGNLVGLSAESALSVVVPLLFAFGGGSAVAFLHKLELSDRRLAAAAVVALSLSCLIGAYTGILVSEHQALSPSKRALDNRTGASSARTTEPNKMILSRSDLDNRTSIVDRKYLRSTDIGEIQLIDQRYKVGEITAQQAYEEIYKLVSQGN
jgi:hypothetical protein